MVLGSLASGGQRMSGAISAADLTTLYGDGMSLYGYVGSGPVSSNDPTGMLIDLLGPSSTLEFETDRMQDTLEAGGRLAYFVANSIDQYAGDMEAMADWALDMTLKDDMFSQQEGADESDGYGYPSLNESLYAYGGKASSSAKKGVSIIKGGERVRIGKLGSYAEMAKETQGYGGKIQAHHLIEKRYTKEGRALAGLNSNNFPAVILTRKQHQMYSAKLQKEFYNLRRKYGNTERGFAKVHEIRAIYERVYAGKPDWLDRVVKYLE